VPLGRLGAVTWWMKAASRKSSSVNGADMGSVAEFKFS
jgi:hypothetical protein